MLNPINHLNSDDNNPLLSSDIGYTKRVRVKDIKLMTTVNIQFLSNYKTIIELAKVADRAYLEQLKFNKTKDDETALSLRELAKKLAIDTPKGVKKSDLVDLIDQTLIEVRNLINKQELEQTEAIKSLQALDMTQTVGQRPIKEVADEAMDIIIDVLKVKGETSFEVIEIQNNILSDYVEVLEKKERAVYVFETISSRRSELIIRLLDLAKITDCEHPKELHNLIKLFQRKYNRRFSQETYEIKTKGVKTAQGNNLNSTEIQTLDLFDAARKAIAKVVDGTAINYDWIEVSKAIAIFTGRRMVETHSLATFTAVGEYEILFSGQAKIHKPRENSPIKKSTSRDNYVIPTLLKATDLVLALEWLGTVKSKKGNTYRIPSETAKANRQAVNSLYSKELNGSINKFYNVEGKEAPEKITYHGLRDIYASICQQLFGFSNKTSGNIFLSKILGHDELDSSTANTYQKFTVTDWQEITKDLRINPDELIKRNNWDKV